MDPMGKEVWMRNFGVTEYYIYKFLCLLVGWLVLLVGELLGNC